MKDLLKLAAECQRDMNCLGIRCGVVKKWEINTRAKRRWGQCRAVGGGAYIISISHRLLEDAVDDQAVKDTIVHELLHTVPGCMKHTGKWKELAERVNRCLPSYHIQRSTSEKDKGVAEAQTAYRYVLKCSKCGACAYRHRSSNFVKHPENYRCGTCGGVFRRII